MAMAHFDFIVRLYFGESAFYAKLDYSWSLIDDHTGHRYTSHPHVLTLYELLDYSAVLLDTHIDCMNTLHLHVLP